MTTVTVHWGLIIDNPQNCEGRPRQTNNSYAAATYYYRYIVMLWYNCQGFTPILNVIKGVEHSHSTRNTTLGKGDKLHHLMFKLDLSHIYTLYYIRSALRAPKTVQDQSIPDTGAYTSRLSLSRVDEITRVLLPLEFSRVEQAMSISKRGVVEPFDPSQEGCRQNASFNRW